MESASQEPKPIEQKLEDAEKCAICLEDIHEPYNPHTVCGPCFFRPCSMKHRFDEKCIDSWIRSRREEATCPQCRAPLIPEGDRVFLNSIRMDDLATVKKRYSNASDEAKNEYAALMATYYGQLDVLHYLSEDCDQELDWDTLITLAEETGNHAIRSYLQKKGSLTETIEEAAVANNIEELARISKKHSKNKLIAAFKESARKGYLNAVQYLYGNCRSVRKYAPDALIRAAGAGQLPIVRYFVETQKMNKRLNLLLELAVDTGHAPLVNYFLDEQHVGANICILLPQAANHGNVAVIHELMQRREIVSILQSPAGTPTHVALNQVITMATKKALEKGHSDIVYYFFHNHFGNPADLLMVIIKNGTMEVLQHVTQHYPLNHGIWEFATQQAIELNKTDIARYLLQQNLCSPRQVFLNALSPHCKKTTDFLTKEYGVQVNLPECLFHIAESDRVDRMPALTRYQHDAGNLTKALLLAAKNGHRGMVQHLLEDHQVKSPIDDAILLADQNGRRDIIEYLAARSATSANLLHQTLLQAIVQKRENLTRRIIQELINRGAPINLEELAALALTTNCLDMIAIIARFIDQQAAASSSQRSDAISLIPQAMVSANIDILPVLIARYRADVNPLALVHTAIQKGTLPALRYFLETRCVECDLNELLRWAHRYDQEAIERYLIESHGKNLDLASFEAWKKSLVSDDAE